MLPGTPSDPKSDEIVTTRILVDLTSVERQIGRIDRKRELDPYEIESIRSDIDKIEGSLEEAKRHLSSHHFKLLNERYHKVKLQYDLTSIEKKIGGKREFDPYEIESIRSDIDKIEGSLEEAKRYLSPDNFKLLNERYRKISRQY